MRLVDQGLRVRGWHAGWEGSDVQADPVTATRVHRGCASMRCVLQERISRRNHLTSLQCCLCSENETSPDIQYYAYKAPPGIKNRDFLIQRRARRLTVEKGGPGWEAIMR